MNENQTENEYASGIKNLEDTVRNLLRYGSKGSDLQIDVLRIVLPIIGGSAIKGKDLMHNYLYREEVLGRVFTKWLKRNKKTLHGEDGKDIDHEAKSMIFKGYTLSENTACGQIDKIAPRSDKDLDGYWVFGLFLKGSVDPICHFIVSPENTSVWDSHLVDAQESFLSKMSNSSSGKTKRDTMSFSLGMLLSAKAHVELDFSALHKNKIDIDSVTWSKMRATNKSLQSFWESYSAGNEDKWSSLDPPSFKALSKKEAKTKKRKKNVP